MIFQPRINFCLSEDCSEKHCTTCTPATTSASAARTVPSKARKRQLRSELHGQVRELAGCDDPNALAKTLVDLVIECEARSSAAGLADKVAVGI